MYRAFLTAHLAIARRTDDRKAHTLTLGALEARILLNTYTWSGAKGTNWFDAGNWFPNGHPGPNDDVNLIAAKKPCVIPPGKGPWAGSQ